MGAVVLVRQGGWGAVRPFDETKNNSSFFLFNLSTSWKERNNNVLKECLQKDINVRAAPSLVDFPKDVGKAFLGRDWRAMALDSTSSLP